MSKTALPRRNVNVFISVLSVLTLLVGLILAVRSRRSS
jgi:hypothetical protein